MDSPWTSVTRGRFSSKSRNPWAARTRCAIWLTSISIASKFSWSAARKRDEMLEPYEWKRSRTVLRRGKVCNPFSLVDFTSRDFTEFCSLQNITQSMSKAGCPYDNAPMESFYGTFKADFINHHSFESDEALNEATYNYIWVYYNHVRPHSSNGYLTPFEKRFS